MSLLCGVPGTEDSCVWLCRVARQGRAGGLSGRERTFIIPSSRYSAQGFVQWHWGGSKLSREEWLWTGDCTGGAELHPNQENNPMDPTAKESQGQWAR